MPLRPNLDARAGEPGAAEAVQHQSRPGGRSPGRQRPSASRRRARPAGAAVAAAARRACPANEPEGTSRPRSRWPRSASSGSTCSHSRCAVRPVSAASSATAVRRAVEVAGRCTTTVGAPEQAARTGGEAVPQVHQPSVAAVGQAREAAGERGAVLVGVEDDETRPPRQAGEQRGLSGPGHPGDEHERPSGHGQPDRGRRRRPPGRSRRGPAAPGRRAPAARAWSRAVNVRYARFVPCLGVIRVAGRQGRRRSHDAADPDHPRARREHRRLDLLPPLRRRPAPPRRHRRPKESTTDDPSVATRAHRTCASHSSSAAATRCSIPMRSVARSSSTTPPVTSSSNHSTRAGAATSPGGSTGA